MTRTTTSPRPASAAANSAAPRDSMRLAAIDVGSNSVHMIVAQADADGGVTTLWRMKEMVGLGRMSFPSRRLSAEAMDRAIASLARFKQAAQQRQAEKIVAVATSAIREATNGGDFIERAKRELGLYVRVVSARDEARLIYLAVRHAVPMGDQPHLVIDVGGGSVEFIVGDEKRAALLEREDRLGVMPGANVARAEWALLDDDAALDAEDGGNLSGLWHEPEREPRVDAVDPFEDER